ncbi:hypothetical protein HDV00_004217 [Rhizophlyctis rosea]|nr:hypothetical protein HDV00_004217 [Rhizophlyctis rosea]
MSKNVFVCPIASQTASNSGLKHLLFFELTSSKPLGPVVATSSFYASAFGGHVSAAAAAAHDGVSAQEVDQKLMFDAKNEIPMFKEWPIKPSQSWKATAAVLVMNKYVAIGTDTGAIFIVLLSALLTAEFDDSDKRAHVVLHGHTGPVTCLWCPDPKEFGGSKMLVSGGADCAVRVWNIETGESLALFVNHGQRVRSFVSAPADTTLKYKNALISIAQDNSLAVIDLDDMNCLYRFTGHPSPIKAIHWRTLDEIMVVECLDGSAYVWQLKTGHLDRVAEGAIVEDILAGCDDSQIGFRNANIKKTLAVYPIYSTPNESPPVFVLQINLKRLINDIYTGTVSQTPPSTPPPRRAVLPGTAVGGGSGDITPRSSATRHRREGSAVSLDSTKQAAEKTLAAIADIFKPRQQSPTKEVKEDDKDKDKRRREREDSVMTITSPVDKESSGVVEGPKEAIDFGVVQCILSGVLVWGASAEMDTFYAEKLGLPRPSSRVAFGMRGANGYLSILAPTTDASTSDWVISPTLTATRLLTTLALAKAVLSSQSVDEASINSITKFYETTLPQAVGPHFEFTSFSYLAKYWQDPIVDIQQAARNLFSVTLSQMSLQQKHGIISYWRPYLPAVVKSDQKYSKMSIRATVIVGMIGSDQKDLLSVKDCKEVSESLELLLREETRTAYKTPAVELIGRGFATWEPHVNAALVLRTLIQLTGLAPPTKGAPPPASNVPSSASGTASPITGGMAKDGGASASPSPTRGEIPSGAGGATASPAKQQQLTPTLIMLARQAIVQIATINTALFVSTLTFDLVHSRSAAERAGWLKLLGMFIAKKPTILYSQLSKLVEAMVKCLDPNLPHMRDALQQIVTVNFAELVKMYPNVAFHHGLQRLSVGTVEGVIVVYDLRTATKVQVMEGHKRPVMAVSFSPDGRLIASFSLEDNQVQIWQPTSGFLGTIASAFGGSADAGLGAVGGGQMKSFRTFHAGPPETNIDLATAFREVKFEWTGERAVKLHSVRGMELAFHV